jgi:Tol biopolymer transport system component
MLFSFTMLSAALLTLLAALLTAGAALVGSQQPRSEIAYLAYHEVMPDIFLADVTRGMIVNLTDHPSYDGAPAWSHDGEMIAFASDREGTLQIYVMDSTGHGLRRLTNNLLSYTAPRWTPDGRIIFTSLNSLANDWFTIYPDGSGFEQIASGDDPITGIALDLGIDLNGESWLRSPDDQYILYTTWLTEQREWGLFFASDIARRDGQLLALTGRTASEQFAWSPDGAFVAYIGAHDGTTDVYTVPTQPPHTPRRLTTNRTIEALVAWRPDES